MPFAGGDGSQSNPYQIETWEHLDSVRNNLSSYFVLNNDLDSNTSGYDTYASSNANSNNGWIPLGDTFDGFEGSFDGQGYAIRDLYINRDGSQLAESRAGLFSRVGNTVSNLAVINADITYTESFANVGIIAGDSQSLIEECYTSGYVTGQSANVGGIIGECLSNTLSNCYSVATVENSGGNAIGGLVGYHSGTIETSYFAGEFINITEDVEGVVGYNSGGTTTDCYWDVDKTNVSTSSATSTGLTTSEMQGSSASTNMSGFDFTSTWETVEIGNVYGSTTTGDGYPILQSLDGETQVLAQDAALPSAGVYLWTGSTWKKVAGV